MHRLPLNATTADPRGSLRPATAAAITLLVAFLGAVDLPAQTDLQNGANHYGTILSGQSNVWTVAVNANDTLLFRVGTTNFTPLLHLLGPTGALLESAAVNSPANRDTSISYRATNSGTLTLTLASFYANGTGPYRLTLVQVPGAFSTSPGDEGGPLTNGANHHGTVELGDPDAYTFSANAGDGINLRVGTTNLTPVLRLYGPDGALLETAVVNSPANRDTSISYRATNSGTFTAVLGSWYANGTGPYRLVFVQAPGPLTTTPGDEGGPLTNGSRHPGTVELGDLDAYTFSANAGESIELRVGTGDFTPLLRLYTPDGTLADSAAVNSPANRDTSISYRATNSGIFTVVLGSWYANGVGAYRLHFAQAPGTIVTSTSDEGGTMTNGATHTGTIDIGDLDLYAIEAVAGESIALRVGTGDFTPLLRLYTPDGTLADSAAVNSPANRDTSITYRATNSGTFTVVLGSWYANGVGPYRLSLAQAPKPFITSPGDEGGSFTNGANHNGNIEVGDLDFFSLEAVAGDTIAVRVGTGAFTPVLSLLGPDGALLDTAAVNSPANRDTYLLYRATNSGTFSVVLGSYYANGGGLYHLSVAQAPIDFTVSANDEGGGMNGGTNYPGQIGVGDLDVWRFTACELDQFALKVSTSNFTPWMLLFGPDGAQLKSAAINSPANREATISHTATNSGTFVVLIWSWYANGTGAYDLAVNNLSDEFRFCPPRVIGSDVKLTAIGAPGEAPYVLWSSPHVETAFSQWTPLLTNACDRYGMFIYARQLDENFREQYYRAQLP